MNSGMDNQKQLAVAGVLGIGCIAAIGNALWQVHAAHSAPAPVVNAAPAAASGNNNKPAVAPAPAPAGAPSADPVGAAAAATKLTEADLVPLPPEQLRNPFQGPADTAAPAATTPPAASAPKPAPAAPAGLGPNVIALARAVRPTPAVQASRPAPSVSRRARVQPEEPQWSSPLPPALPPVQTYQPRMLNTQVVRMANSNLGGTNPAPPVFVKPVPPPPPTPAQLYEIDAATLRSSFVVRGVLVSDASAAFVTINGVQQVVHQGDLLPGGFQVATITETGIVVFYNKSAGLNKSFAIAL